MPTSLLPDTPCLSSPRLSTAADMLISHKSSPKSLHSFLRSVAGSSSSSNYSGRESALVFANYLSSHFSVFQPKALHSKALSYLSELRRTTCPEESHSFCSPFFPIEFFAAATNISSPTATGPDKVAYSMLKHFLRSGMDFLLIFNLS